MSWAIKQLLARGYWEEAGEGTGGSSGDGAGDGGSEGGAGESGTGNEGTGAAEAANKPTEAEAKLLKEVMNKKNRIKALEDELNGMKSNLERFSGIDPDQVAALLKEKEDAERLKLESKGEWEKLKERMAAEHAKEKQQILDELKAERERMSSVNQTIERLTIGHNFDNATYIIKETVLTPRKARQIYGAHFDVDANGEVIGHDKPRGEPGRSQLIGGDGNPLSFNDALKRLVDADPDRDEILRSKRKNGAGSETDRGKPADIKRPMSSVDKIAAGLASRQQRV
jgi:hypothetical protein